MGLDMYLTAERYLSSWHPQDAEHIAYLQNATGLIPEGFRPNSVSVEVGCWRKANQIHNWFVAEVQDGRDECQTSYVSRDQLEELLKLCRETIAEPEKAEENLPTACGFFFGSTEYDECYLSDLEETVAILEKALALPEADWDFHYRASW